MVCKTNVAGFGGVRTHELILDNKTTPNTFASRTFECGFRPRFIIMSALQANSGGLHTKIRLDQVAFPNLNAYSLGTAPNIGVTAATGSTSGSSADIIGVTDTGYTLRVGTGGGAWNDVYSTSLKITAIE